MKPNNLILRCYAERDQGSWFAMCLDLNLYARGDTFEDARASLHQIIEDYVVEALTDDSDYADQLLQRKAPVSFWLRYYRGKATIFMKDKLHMARDVAIKLFNEPLPVAPAH